MTEFNITNETGSPIVFATLDDFTIAAAATKDVFAVANGNFAVGDIIDNSELQGLLDATDISIEDESSNVITDLFIIDDLLATGNTKLDFISITQAVDLDTLESNVATNNAKVTNATHTGEVTGSGTLTVDSTAISNKASVTAVAGMDILVDDSGTLKKVDADDFLSAGSGLDVLETATLDGSIITPAQLLADQDDYNPTGFSTCQMIRQDINGDRVITGFVAPAAGVNRIFGINNLSGSSNIKFKNNDSGSVAANRLLIRDDGPDKSIHENETAILWYDHTSSRWRPYNRIG